MAGCDILISGTGGFAARIAFDIAATGSHLDRHPAHLRRVIAGRNRERLNWLRTAANARAALFGRKARFRTHASDLLEPDASDALLAAIDPRVVVQAASIQTSQVIAQSGNAWTRLVAEGGLSATAVFQALISSRVAAAISRSGKPVTLVNCSFPDVVNGIITALGGSISLSSEPGHTLFTRMPSRPTSSARLFMYATTPMRVTPESARFGIG